MADNMLDEREVVTGYNLLRHCQDEKARGRVRAFLGGRGDQGLQDGAQRRAGNIFVLRGRLGTHLSVAESISDMPMLQRTGRYSPSMVIPDLDEVSTDADLQRLGSPYITLQGAVGHLVQQIRCLAALWESGTLGIFGGNDEDIWKALKPLLNNVELKDKVACDLSKRILTKLLSGENSPESFKALLKDEWAKAGKPAGQTLQIERTRAKKVKVLARLLKSQVHLWKHLQTLNNSQG